VTPSQPPLWTLLLPSDAGEEIYAGLLYFRAPMDTCVGGDLEVIKCRRKDHKCIKLSDKVRAYYAKKGLAGLQFHPRDMEVSERDPARSPLRVSSGEPPSLRSEWLFAVQMGSILNHATSPNEPHARAHQAAFHQHSIGATLSNPLLKRFPELTRERCEGSKGPLW